LTRSIKSAVGRESCLPSRCALTRRASRQYSFYQPAID
jgi:hypothetical protein